MTFLPVILNNQGEFDGILHNTLASVLIMTRKIPATMVSQHPDHARKPYWHHEEFISTRHEVDECFRSFSELGVSEYKWDWEGKLVDESVMERLFGEHFDYFKKSPLGKDKFLTFRLPNPKVETEFRLGRAFMGILGAAGLAREIGLHSPPHRLKHICQRWHRFAGALDREILLDHDFRLCILLLIYRLTANN